MIKNYLILCLALTSFTNQAKDLDFIKNLGQWNSKAKYKVNLQGGNLFIEDTELTYLFYDANTIHKLHELEHQQNEHTEHHDHLIDAYSFKVELLNANPNALKNGINKKNEYNNYFIGNNREKWKGNVPIYSGVNYTSIYDGINLNLYSTDLNLKYDFVVSPHANPNKIKLQYKHTNNTKLVDGNLYINIGFNTIIEQKPYAYQDINGERIEIECHYNYEGNTLSFNFPNSYNKDYELVIDPVLIASTLSGSTVTNYGHSATFDSQGNIYTGARNFGVGYPTTFGAFQMAFGGGGTDISISKLSPDGSTLIWASYIGGNSSEYPHSMYVQNSELYVLGSSDSPNFPITENAFDNTNSSTDIVLSHLSEDGTSMIGSTFVGGSGTDGTNSAYSNYGDTYRGEIIVDEDGNPFVASFTQSSNFPTTTGAFQTTNAGGQDGVIFKMNPDLSSMLWSTHLGGPLDDAAFGLRLDTYGDLYVTGSSGDSNFPSTTNAAIPNFIGGDADAYIAKFSSDGSTLLSSSFFGSDGKDQSYFLDIDTNGDVYIYGQNTETINMSPGCYGTANSAQFVAQFSPDLATINWQTTIGTGGIGGSSWQLYDFVPVAFMVDVCKHIYISGYSAVSGLFTSPNPIISSGGFYELVLEADATAINYATYYSGDHVDGGTSRFDPSGKIYQAVCSGGGFNTTPNAYATNQSGGWDIGIFKIDLNTSVVTAQAIANPSTTGCAPFMVNFSNNSTTGTYDWDFGDGSNSTQTDPSHTFTEAGEYNVELIVTDPESCNFSDTLIVPIYVSSSTGEYSFSIDNACLGTPIQFSALGATNQDTIQWNLGDGTLSTDLNPLHNYSTTGTYDIELTIHSLCNFTSTFNDQIDVDIEPNLELGEDQFICQNEEITITAVSNANNYLWQDNTTNNFIDISSAGIYSVQASNGDCMVIDDIVITQDPFSFDIGNDTTLCSDSAILTIDAGQNAASYLWNTGETTQTISVSEGYYAVEVISDLECMYEDQIDIQVQEFNMDIESSSQEECVPSTIDFTDLSTVNTGSINEWLWDFEIETNTSSIPSIYYDQADIYDVTLTLLSEEGCSEQLIISDYIQINPNPSAHFEYTYTVENGCQVRLKFTNNSSGEDYYHWSFSHAEESYSENPEYIFEYNQNYEILLEVENEFGCIDEISKELEIPRLKPIYVPNVFTPDNDQINDTFHPISECIEDITFSIFDRWGKLLFVSEDITNGWDGRYNGELQNNDNYTWKLIYSMNGEIFEDTGFVVLLN